MLSDDWYEKFDLFDEKHYTIKIVEATMESCLEIFKCDCVQWPTMKFGTHVSSIEKKGDLMKMVIKRFKTEDLCRLHVQFPSTEERQEKTCKPED